MPTHIGQSDACEHGIGRFSATTAIAWRWEIPVHLQWRATLNALEYMAGYVQLCMDISVGSAPCKSCFLSQTDSTSAAAWLRKSNFNDLDPLHLEIARATATLMIDHNSCLYSQWFKRAENEVADSLSHDHYLSDNNIVSLLLSNIPSQVPKDFRICPLPPNVKSKITSWLLSLPTSMQSPTEPLHSKLTIGGTGSTTLKPLSLTMTHSSPTSPEATSIESLPALELPSDPMTCKTMWVHQQRLHQYLKLSVPPSTLWHKPSRLMISPAQSMTMMASLHSFYNEY